MKLNLMDYSLLLAIHDSTRAEEEEAVTESEEDVVEVYLSFYRVTCALQTAAAIWWHILASGWGTVID